MGDHKTTFCIVIETGFTVTISTTRINQMLLFFPFQIAFISTPFHLTKLSIQHGFQLTSVTELSDRSELELRLHQLNQYQYQYGCDDRPMMVFMNWHGAMCMHMYLEVCACMHMSLEGCACMHMYLHAHVRCHWKGVHALHMPLEVCVPISGCCGSALVS